MTRSLRPALAAFAALLLATGTASAGLLPVSVTITPENDKFRWTYAIVLPTDSQIQSGDYFTIYDFAGYNPDTNSQPDGWSFSATPAGPTPDRVDPYDDASIPNLSWAYTGATIPSGQLGLGNFWAISDYGVSTDSYFTATTHRTSDGEVDTNITQTTVPVPVAGPPPPTVPEPTTLALAALGLPLVGLARAVRRRG